MEFNGKVKLMVSKLENGNRDEVSFISLSMGALIILHQLL